MEKITRNVALCGKYATGYQDGRPVPDTYLWREDTKRSLYETPVERLDGLTVSLVNCWSSNYFHWLLEGLTHLLCIDPAKIDHIIVGTARPERIRTSLEYLGLVDKLRWWDWRKPLEVDLISFGPQRVDGYSYVPGLERLIDTFKQTATGPRSIFVDRQGANVRRVVNVQAFLKANKGYKAITPDGTVMEQAAYFGNARHIAGPNGAGLTNMIWTKKCKVTDFYGGYYNPCFEKLAGQLGHEYEAVHCKPVGEDMRWE
jgi:capsular polysaccharide biosynthesis protein